MESLTLISRVLGPKCSAQRSRWPDTWVSRVQSGLVLYLVSMIVSVSSVPPSEI